MGIVLFYFEEIGIAIHAEIAKQVAARFAKRTSEAQENGKILTFIWVTLDLQAWVSGFENTQCPRFVYSALVAAHAGNRSGCAKRATALFGFVP